MDTDIFGDKKLFTQVALLKDQAAAKQNASIDAQIADLRAREDLDPEELGKRLNELYRLKVGAKKLKTY